MQLPQMIRKPTHIAAHLMMWCFGLCIIRVGSFGHNSRADEECPCADPLEPSSGKCYTPVCAPGSYKCCASCQMSTCVGRFDMQYSTRGIAECIPCPAGYYCTGCDVYRKCKPYSPPTAKKDDEPKISVSKIGSKEELDCTQCSDAEDANLERDRCIEMYNDVCNAKLLKRCYNGCLASDGTKNLTPCEKMKCLMYCAKSWSDECHDALRRTCRSMTSPPPIKDDPEFEIDLSQYLIDCDVNCDSAGGLSFVAILPAVMLAALMY